MQDKKGAPDVGSKENWMAIDHIQNIIGSICLMFLQT